MSAPKGNQFWKLAPRMGRQPIWPVAGDLMSACEQYFEEIVNDPIIEDGTFAFQGVVTHEPIHKMRAMTVEGLCVFLGISKNTWRSYNDDSKQDFLSVYEYVSNIMYDYKFVGASSGQLNQSIIARDLGLKDKTELTGEDGGPIQTATTFNFVPVNSKTK